MFTFKLAQQYSALQEEECLYVQPIYTPLGYCRHVTLDVFWLKGEKAFRFESEDAELSIDNIYMTSADVASVHSAYVVAGGHSCVLHVARGQVHCWGSGSSGQLGQGNTENIGDDMNLGCPQVVP